MVVGPHSVILGDDSAQTRKVAASGIPAESGTLEVFHFEIPEVAAEALVVPHSEAMISSATRAESGILHVDPGVILMLVVAELQRVVVD